MRFSVAAAILSAAASVRAATFNVRVGDNNALVFNPTNLTGVANGDIVNFQFVSKNHSVVQSTFAAPCTGAGVSSGFQDVSDPSGASGFPTWSMTVENASAPLWFFCGQVTPNSTHCQMGMVFAINPTAAKSFDAFQQAAIATNATAPAPGQNPSGSIVSGVAGATDAALSVSGVATASAAAGAPSASAAPSSSSGSGVATDSAASGASSASSTSDSSSDSGSATDSATSAGATSSSTNGASHLMSGSSISLFAVAGLIAGLVL